MESSTRVVVVPSVTGPVACLDGTGIKVWLVVEAYQRADEDWGRLQQAYSHLSDAQLRAALDYYRRSPAEIDRQIAANAGFDIGALWAAHPFTRPPWGIALSSRPAATAQSRTPSSRAGASPSHTNGSRHDGTHDTLNMTRAGQMGRCFVTRDAEASSRLTVIFHELGLPHAGVLILASALACADPELAAAKISAFANAHPDDMPAYTVDWLE